MLIKQGPITSQKLGSQDFWGITCSVFNKGKSAIPLLFSRCSVVSKVFEKPVNDSIFDHLKKCGLFSDFQYGFRSSQSNVNLTVVSDRIARAFNRSGAPRAVALDISEAFVKVWHAAVVHKLKFYGISGQIFCLISSFLTNRRLQVVLNGKLLLEFLKPPFLVLHFSYYRLMSFLKMLSVILLSMLMILLSILSVIRHLICGNN